MKRIKVIISDESESLATIIRAEDKATVENVLDHVLDFGQEEPTLETPFDDLDIWFNVKIFGSDAIREVSYNFFLKELDITFIAGNQFPYANVPVGVFIGLVSADSVGSYYQQQIKGRY